MAVDYTTIPQRSQHLKTLEDGKVGPSFKNTAVFLEVSE